MWHRIYEACRAFDIARGHDRNSQNQRPSEVSHQAMRALTGALHGYMQSQVYALDALTTRAALREWDTACRDAPYLLVTDPGSSIDPEYYIRRQAQAVAVMQATPAGQHTYAVNLLFCRKMRNLRDRRLPFQVDHRLLYHISDLVVINNMIVSCQYNQLGHSAPSQVMSLESCPAAKSMTTESKQAAKSLGV